MTNRLAMMEHQAKKKKQNKSNILSQSTQKKASIKPKKSAARSLSARLKSSAMKSSSFSTGSARGFNSSFQYRVPGTFNVLAQPSSMACWATVFTMLQSWRYQESLSIENALGYVSPKWVGIFKQNTGLSASQKINFVSESGLVAEPPMSHSIEGWRHMLETYGPLWVTTDEDPSQAFAIHARIIVGIERKSDDVIELSIIDPAGGREYKESFDVFIPKYEEEIRRAGRTRIQVLHWREDALIAIKQGKPVSAYAVRSYAKSNTDTILANPELQQKILELQQQGISSQDIQEFLTKIGLVPATAKSMSGGTSISLPGGTLLEGWEARIFMASLGSSFALIPGGMAFFILMPAIQAICNRANVTIGIGPAITGGAVAGLSGGAGILFAPGNRIGFYGSSSAVLGAIVSISGTIQVTIVKGGPSNFSGNAVLAGFTIGTDNPALPVGVTGGVHSIMNTSGSIIGVTFEMGIAAGLSPFEAFVQFQHTSSTLGVKALSLTPVGFSTSAHQMSTFTQAYSESLPPLSPAIGGQSIDESSLEKGDIILSTTPAAISVGIRLATQAPISHAAIYIGHGQIIEAVGEGVVLRQLDAALSDDSVAVALRYPGLSELEAQKICDFAGRQLDKPYNTFGIVRHGVLRIEQQKCELIPHAGLRQACKDNMAKLYLGTADNQSFFCSQLVAAAYESAGVPLMNTRPEWMTPADLAGLRQDQVTSVVLNVRLDYVGHLKA